MKLVDMQDLLFDALEADLENGVSWMNDEAWEKFKQSYPKTWDAINRIHTLRTKDPDFKDSEFIVDGEREWWSWIPEELR